MGLNLPLTSISSIMFAYLIACIGVDNSLQIYRKIVLSFFFFLSEYLYFTVSQQYEQLIFMYIALRYHIYNNIYVNNFIYYNLQQLKQ